MTTAIFKYALSTDALTEPQDIAVPGGGTVVHVAEQNGVPTVWVRCYPGAPPGSLRLRVVATGQPFPDDYVYRGTAHCGPLVWHVLGWEPF